MVIPARNESNYLPRLLDTVDDARKRYRLGRSAIEVIVSDNASTDDTAAIAARRGCRVVRVEKRSIAAVRNTGARAAHGRVLAFVDADFQIHPETFNVIDEVLAGDKVIGGVTSARAERLSFGIAATFCYMMPIVWVTGIDQGLYFCRREDYAAVNGFNEKRRFGEDVQFMHDLKVLGRRRGQKFIRVTRVKAVTSARKFDKYGEWHYPLGQLGLLLLFVFSRRRFKEAVEDYWYGDHR